MPSARETALNGDPCGFMRPTDWADFEWTNGRESGAELLVHLEPLVVRHHHVILIRRRRATGLVDHSGAAGQHSLHW